MIKPPKTRCNGTMTEAAFRGMIRSGLRRLTLAWAPKNAHLEEVRRPYKTAKGGNSRSKWEYQCVACKQWFIRSHIELDHKVMTHSIKSLDDIPAYINSLFVEKDGWNVYCKLCHKARTKEQRSRK